MAVSLKKPVVSTTYSDRLHKIGLVKETTPNLSRGVVNAQNDVDEIYPDSREITGDSPISVVMGDRKDIAKQEGITAQESIITAVIRNMKNVMQEAGVRRRKRQAWKAIAESRCAGYEPSLADKVNYVLKPLAFWLACLLVLVVGAVSIMILNPLLRDFLAAELEGSWLMVGSIGFKLISLGACQIASLWVLYQRWLHTRF